jgi:hypothetical protein
MGRYLLVSLMLSISLLLQMCSKNPDDTDDNGLSIVVRLMEADSAVVTDSIVQKLSAMATVDLGGGILGIKMTDFIPNTFIKPYVDKNTVSWDRRVLYGYRIAGSDGFSPHIRIDSATGRPLEDLNWESLQHGFIKKDSRDAAYDSTLFLRGAYRVKDVAAIELYRKIDVSMDSAGNQTTRQIRLAEMPKYTFPDSTSALSVKLPDVLTMLIDGDSTTITGVDGYYGNRCFTWTQIQTGFWIEAIDQTKFNPDLGGSSRIKYVGSIAVTKQ